MIVKKRMLRMSAGVLAGLCVLGAGTWILSRALGNHQTTYQGKSLYYWSVQLTNQDAGASNKAAAVLYSQIIPHLTNRMFSDTNDSKLRLALIDELNTLPGIQVDFAGATSRRVQAVMDLGSFGSRAKSAAPALLEALKRQDDVLCEPAASALVSIQAEPEAVIPALIGCMVDDRGHGRSDVVEALAQYGPRAKAAVPTLVKLLKDRSSKEIVRAVPRALRQIDPEAAAGAGVKQ
jgi:HEAT repeat protein